VEKEKDEEMPEAVEEEVKVPVDLRESVKETGTEKPVVLAKAKPKPVAPKKIAEACQMSESTDMSTVKIGRYLTVRTEGLWRILRVVSIEDVNEKVVGAEHIITLRSREETDLFFAEERLKNMTGKEGNLDTKNATTTQQLNKVKEEMKKRDGAAENRERIQNIREKIEEKLKGVTEELEKEDLPVTYKEKLERVKQAQEKLRDAAMQKEDMADKAERAWEEVIKKRRSVIDQMMTEMERRGRSVRLV